MARVDSLLQIVLQERANELRLGTDREPKILAQGTPKRFHIPATNEETLRALLGEILSPEREQSLNERGRVELSYETGAGVAFLVALTARGGGGFDAVFLQSLSRAAHLPSAPGASAPSPAALAPPPASASFGAAPESFDPGVAPSSRGMADASPRSVGPGRIHQSELVHRAMASRATDLHVVDGDSPVLRVDGRLRRLGDGPVPDVLEALGVDATTRTLVAKGQSVELSFDVDGGVRARAHFYRTSTGNAAAIRLFAHTPSSLASLNMPIPLDDLVELPHGLVILCGATGSGKSTTLAALAQQALRRRSIVLVTLEDPIEYTLTAGEASIVRQRQVGRDVRDFATGLRDALREDPDVLIVGEMRDPESIALALTAAETGHLVIATLHSGSAASAIERIVDSYPPERQSQIRTQVAEVVRAVVAQRLLPRTRGSGRIPALEVLRMNHAAASLVREGKIAQLASVLQSGRRDGMISLERSLADRVLAGEVRVEHARAVANDVEAFTLYTNK